MSHRDDCHRGKNFKFVLHHFPIILTEVLSIHKFWKCMEPHVEKNPKKEELAEKLLKFIVIFH